MIEVTFWNVTVTICAEDAKSAYNQLCQALSDIPACEFFSDTFDAEAALDRDTSELWPEPKGDS